MRTIWKFPIKIEDTDNNGRLEVKIPGHFIKPLAFQFQGYGLFLWAECNDHQPLKSHWFRVVGTGHELPRVDTVYVGTVQDGSFVWHLYYEVDNADPLR